MLLTFKEPYYFDKKAIAMVDKWVKENEDRIKDPFLSLHWYEPIGSGPGMDEEKEVTFDNVQELAKFLKENPRLAEKVGPKHRAKKSPRKEVNLAGRASKLFWKPHLSNISCLGNSD